MSARHKARKRALDFLFEADLRKLGPFELFSIREKSEISEQAYAGEIIQGVLAHKDKIDELIGSNAVTTEIVTTECGNINIKSALL